MKLLIPLFIFVFTSCDQPVEQEVIQATDSTITNDTSIIVATEPEQPQQVNYTTGSVINTGTTLPPDLVNYAKTLMGVPYLYGSTNPQNGFDCSGFITYVFNHFNIAVPRSSVDFTNVQHEVPIEQAAPGDLILFTGTDSTIKVVGHMGIVTENNMGNLQFIHSTSGKQYGVTITPLEKYYMDRFVKVIRVFK